LGWCAAGREEREGSTGEGKERWTKGLMSPVLWGKGCVGKQVGRWQKMRPKDGSRMGRRGFRMEWGVFSAKPRSLEGIFSSNLRLLSRPFLSFFLPSFLPFFNSERSFRHKFGRQSVGEGSVNYIKLTFCLYISSIPILTSA
jgi:hypothetical protein